MTVGLTPCEVEFAAWTAIRRHTACMFKPEKKQSHGVKPAQRWQLEVEGALGEVAVAKALNRFYCNGIPHVHGAPDVDVYEVRFTRKDDGCLVMHDHDHDHRPYILVTGNLTYRVVDGELLLEVRGWLWGHETKQRTWLDDPTDSQRWAYFVPQEALRDLATLPSRDEVLALQPDVPVTEARTM